MTRQERRRLERKGLGERVRNHDNIRGGIIAVRTCETCKKDLNKLEEAGCVLTLDSLPTEEMYLCYYHAMSLVQDLAMRQVNFKLKSLIDGTVYLPAHLRKEKANG